MPSTPLRVPPTRDFPTIRRSLAFYRIFAFATGTGLLLVCAELVLHYVLLRELVVTGGGLALVPSGHWGAGAFDFVPAARTVLPPANLSVDVLMLHGYLYITYLLSDFILITVLRYPITRFIVIALGGVVPFLSFITERRVHREVTDYLAEREAQDAASAGAAPAADIRAV